MAPVPQQLDDILEELCRTANAEITGKQVLPVFDESMGVDISGALVRYLEKTRGKPNIPLVVSADPELRRRAGFALPSEFLLPLFDVSRLARRAAQLRAVHREGIDRIYMQSFCMGAFRRYLFLDDENHGRGELDLNAVRAGHYRSDEAERSRWLSSSSWQKLYESRLERTDEGDVRNALFRALYADESKKILAKMKALTKVVAGDAAMFSRPSPGGEYGSLAAVQQAADEFENALPRLLGHDLRFHLPGEKGCVMLIDDRANEARAGLEETTAVRPGTDGSTQGPKMSVFFDIEAANLRPKGTVRDYGVQVWEAFPGDNSSESLRRFDLLLLDLNLGEGPLADFAGYQCLPILKKFFPEVVIMAFTRYGNMSHIERAFARGATWFLSKADAWKLPECYCERLQHKQWVREWTAIRSGVDWDIGPGERVDEASRYLIWKAMEGMPGGTIRVKGLAGGIGGARTLRAVKAVNDRYNRATPVVIKIDERFRMLMERERYYRFVHPYLSNLVGRIEQPLAEGGDNRASLAYSYAGTGQGVGERSARRSEVVTLENLLQRNLPKSHDQILGPDVYAELFEQLLGDVLPRLHVIDPRSELSELDYPNAVFEESASAVDSYLLRMPPEAIVAVDEPVSSGRKNLVNHAISSLDDIQAGQELLSCVYDVEHGPEPYIKAVARLQDGYFHRLDLKGLLGGFYVDHRYLRPMRPLVIRMKEKPLQGELEAWTALWWARNPNPDDKARPQSRTIEYDQTVDGCVHTFESAGLTLIHPRPALAVVGLRRWLVSRMARVLDGGRIGIVHGDMNLGNVLVERERGSAPKPVFGTPWLIDFARTRRDRIVVDYTQFELDLGLRLLDPRFFPSLRKSRNNWTDVDEFFSYLLETPWTPPRVAERVKRLRLVYALVSRVRAAADKQGIDEKEYLVSRTFQLLIIHKIICGRWRRNPADEGLQFLCVLTLKLALTSGRAAGWSE